MGIRLVVVSLVEQFLMDWLCRILFGWFLTIEIGIVCSLPRVEITTFREHVPRHCYIPLARAKKRGRVSLQNSNVLFLRAPKEWEFSTEDPVCQEDANNI